MKASVVLNISADHLDRYENIAAYALSKQAIYSDAETLVVNKDDELAGNVAGIAGAKINKKVVGFTLSQPKKNEFGLCVAIDKAETNQTTNLCYGEKVLISADELKIKGLHNLQNALASLALGHAIGLSFEDMVDALKTFTGLPHRTQYVATTNGVDWINDSKATNVGAAVAALAGLPGKQILIAGGEAKDADFSTLGEAIEQHCRAVILLGKDADKINEVISDSVTVKFVPDMKMAVSAAYSLAEQGDNVLLAPACASFDMFDNFEQRGDVFMREVKNLHAEFSGVALDSKATS